MKTLLTQSRLLTIGQVADHFGVQAWKVLRLYQRGLLPEPTRVGRNRVVKGGDLFKVKFALMEAGYLEKTTNAHAAQEA